MNFAAFKQTIQLQKPPALNSPHLLAMWYDAREDWEAAHHIIQDLHDRNASLIHAYLHRKEGDTFNAGYWYSKAGSSMPDQSIEKEWETIVIQLLSVK